MSNIYAVPAGLLQYILATLHAKACAEDPSGDVTWLVSTIYSPLNSS